MIESVGHAIATIDAGMWMMANLKERYEKMCNLSPIERMVDKSTGYDKIQRKEIYDNMIMIASDIKEAKEYIGEETDKEDELIKFCTKYLENL